MKDVCPEVARSEYSVDISSVGIYASELTSYLTDQYASEKTLFLGKYESAVQVLRNDIRSHFAPTYRALSVLNNQRAGMFHENQKIIEGVAGRVRGLQVQYNDTSSYLDFYLSSLSLQLNYDGEVKILVYDLIQAKLLDEIQVNVTAGEIETIYLRKIYNAPRQRLNLLIGYETDGIDSMKATVDASGCNGCGDLPVQKSRLLSLRPASISAASQKIDQNIKGEKDTAGISITYSLQCNHENWTCDFSNLMALPLAYRTSAEILDHAYAHASNEQVNMRTGVNKEDLLIRRDLYERKYSEQLSLLLKTIKPPHDEICFQCRKSIRTAVLLP